MITNIMPMTMNLVNISMMKNKEKNVEFFTQQLFCLFSQQYILWPQATQLLKSQQVFFHHILKKELFSLNYTKKKIIGSHAFPDFIHFTPGLPKTRSGKIMRRILRKIAANEHDQLGDITTLADPSVVESLVENRKNR